MVQTHESWVLPSTDTIYRLENKVIDIEVAHSTPSPTIDPSVHTILIGHSMGGLVAAETFMLLASEQPIPAASSEAPNFPSNTTLNSTTSTSHPDPTRDGGSSTTFNTFIFPHIQGILAFDTPFLGLAPGMVAHSLEGGHKMASSAYGAFSEISSAFGWGSISEPSVPSTSSKPVAALPAPSSSAADAAATPKWQSWGKYAMFAGAAGAVAAGGAAALYSQREKISAGWNWASGHLLFIGTLAKPEELSKRVRKLVEACQERGVGSANFYTNLGKGAREGYGVTSDILGKERTFCNLPTAVAEGRTTSDNIGLQWYKAINEKAKDETMAHTSMFFPRENPGFYTLGERAKEVVSSWIDEGWYASSEMNNDGQTGGTSFGVAGDEWIKPECTTSKEGEKSGDGEWEGLDRATDFDDDTDVKMTDEVLDATDKKENMGGSVIVDKAMRGEIPLSLSQGI
jgi:hypothetical protein